MVEKKKVFAVKDWKRNTLTTFPTYPQALACAVYLNLHEKEKTVLKSSLWTVEQLDVPT